MYYKTMVNCSFETTYISKSDHVKYKKSRIEKIYRNHPLFKNINCNSGILCFDYSRCYNYKTNNYSGGKSLMVWGDNIGSLDSFYKINFSYRSIIKKYNFDQDEQTLMFSIDKIDVYDKYNDCNHKLDNVTFAIKFNKSGNRKMKSILRNRPYKNLEI